MFAGFPLDPVPPVVLVDKDYSTPDGAITCRKISEIKGAMHIRSGINLIKRLSTVIMADRPPGWPGH